MKKCWRVAATAMVFLLAGCSARMEPLPENSGQPQTVQDETAADYAQTLFDVQRVHEVRVTMAEADLEDLKENPLDKTKYTACVSIDGETVDSVSFATKGNSSLTQVAKSDSNRYSFKIIFDKYISGQTYHGLDRLHLNNLISDPTCMKDYLSYRIMQQAGVAAPLASYTVLYINDTLWGLYLAVEDVNVSFLQRNFGQDAGQLYKPETQQLDMANAIPNADGDRPERQSDSDPSGQWASFMNEAPTDAQESAPIGTDGQTPNRTADPEAPQGNPAVRRPQEEQAPGNFDPGQRDGFGLASNGADLVYTDDEIASYSDIFDNAVTDVQNADCQRVIAALKTLSTGKDLETCVDVDAVLRYFAAHNFVLNGDSYTGSMLHNYYLYETGGRLSMLPWDYNLAFGGFMMQDDAAALVNSPIDTPLSTQDADARPMWSKLAQNETYLAQYHAIYDELLTGYFESGVCEAEIDAIDALVRPYVAQDPTAFYTVEQYDAAVDALKTFCLLRAQSIRGQLDGDIPATKTGQLQQPETLVDSSGLQMEDLGGQQGGGFGGSFPDGRMEPPAVPGMAPENWQGQTPDMAGSTDPAGPPRTQTPDASGTP